MLLNDHDWKIQSLMENFSYWVHWPLCPIVEVVCLLAKNDGYSERKRN